MKYILNLIFAAATLLAAACSSVSFEGTVDNSTLAELCSGAPFRMERVTLPVIPDRTESIADYGAVGDGITLNSEPFAKAIAALVEKGGGHLLVPEGIWLTGPIRLESGIDLHLDDNAVILFSSDRDLYPIIETVFEGLDCRRCESPISAVGAKNVSITGGGVIDGNGGDWRSVKKSKMNAAQWKRKIASGGILSEDGSRWYPDEGFIEAEKNADMNVPRGIETEEQWQRIKSFLRPVMVSFRGCENVWLDGVTFQNSPCWNLHPLQCRNVVISGVTVRNPEYSQNGDGIDIESCENTVLVNSAFDCGDDGICVKSGKDEDGRRRAAPCRNLIVKNCVVYHGHGGFVVGSEMSGGVENVQVSSCRFLGTDVGLRFKSKRGRGGVVRNIFIDHIMMTDMQTEAILFDLHYGGVSAVEAMEKGETAEIEPVKVDETTPAFREIYISDIVCNGAARAMYFNGIPEMPVTGVNIERCTITSRRGIEICYARDVILKDVNIFPAEGFERLSVVHSENVTEE